MGTRLRRSLNGDRDAAVLDWLHGATATELSRRYRVQLSAIERELDAARADLKREEVADSLLQIEAVLSRELSTMEAIRRAHRDLIPDFPRVPERTDANSWWFGREAHLCSVIGSLTDRRIKVLELRHRIVHGDKITVSQGATLGDVLRATRAARGLPEIDFAGVRS